MAARSARASSPMSVRGCWAEGVSALRGNGHLQSGFLNDCITATASGASVALPRRPLTSILVPRCDQMAALRSPPYGNVCSHLTVLHADRKAGICRSEDGGFQRYPVQRSGEEVKRNPFYPLLLWVG